MDVSEATMENNINASQKMKNNDYMFFFNSVSSLLLEKLHVQKKILPCTLNHLRVGYWYSLVYHMNKNIFLYNHTVTVKIQEMNADIL